MPINSLDHRASSSSTPSGTAPSSLERQNYAQHALSEVGDHIATTKEEEWVTKKTSEVTTTRQIATRVKRELVLEDGRILSDTGPKVSTTAREDTHTSNYHQTEQRILASDDEDGTKEEEIRDTLDNTRRRHLKESAKYAVEKSAISADGRHLTDVPVSTTVTTRRVRNPDGKVMECQDARIVTHKESDRVREVEESFHLGDITDQGLVAAVNETDGDEDLRDALRKRTSETLIRTGPRLLRDETKHWKTIDTENKDELRALKPDGTLVTESKKSTTHEELTDNQLPDHETKSLASNRSYVRERALRERLAKTHLEQRTDFMAGGRRVGTQIHNRVTTNEGEREGDPKMEDPYDWDSLSMRMRKPKKLRHGEHESFLKRPIDFEVEEETRKKETSKWLESHFGSESRSSRDSIVEEVERAEKYYESKTQADEGYFERPSALIPPPPVYANKEQRKPSKTTETSTKVIPLKTNGYFKGIGDWSQRKAEKQRMPEARSGSPYTSDDSPKHATPPRKQSPTYPLRNGRTSIVREDSAYVSSSTVHSPPRGSPYRGVDSDKNNSAEEEYNSRPPAPERRKLSKQKSAEDRYDSGYRSSSRNDTAEPPPDYSRRPSPEPSPPVVTRQRKQYQKTRFAAVEERRRSPARKSVGAAIGNSIRKLVGKIRSASSERRAKWRGNSRSPSPNDTRTYKHYDADVNPPPPPAQRYYLGEDPFADSIYGREHKYEGAQPRRVSKSRKENSDSENRSNNFSSTLGRFSHSTSRLNPKGSEEDEYRSAQTLPRKLQNEKRPTNQPAPTNGKAWHQLGPSKRTNSTVNINGPVNGKHTQVIIHHSPSKPLRTYKALNRSKSFAVSAPETEVKPRYISNMNRNYSTLYKSNPHLSRLDESQEELKSPGIVSIINRSQRDLADAISREVERKRDGLFDTRYKSTYTNGYTNGKVYEDKKKEFMKDLKQRAPELYHSLHMEDEVDSRRMSPRYGTRSPSVPRERNYSEERKVVVSREGSPFVSRFNNEITRLRSPPPAIRRGSNSSDNFSETYRYRTTSGDPERPLVTDTVEKVSKKVVPTRDGRAKEIIESREKNSVTTARANLDGFRYLENGTRLTNFESRLTSTPMISEKKSSNYRMERIRDYRN